MKTTKFMAFVCLIPCLLASCGGNNGPSTETIKQMKEITEEWKVFLSDNYQVGDSVYFQRTDLTTKETLVEGFVVKCSFFAELAYMNESDDDAKKEGETSLSRYVEGYDDIVEIRNKDNFINVTLHASYDDEDHNNEIIETHRVYINNFSCDEISHHKIEKDLFTLSTCAAECTMQRNVGIIQFSNDHYSWKLIQ